MTREIRAHIWFKMIDKNGDRTESVLNAAKIHLYTQEAWWTVPEEIDEWTTPTSQSADLTPKAVGMPTTPQQFSDLTAIVLGPKDQTVADFIGNLRYRFKDYDKKEIVIKFLDAQNYIGYDLNELQFATLLDCFSSVTIDCGYHNVIFPETKEASLNRLSISNANIKFPAVEMFASNFSLENCSLEGIDDPVFVRITTEESCSISRTSFKNALYLQVQAKAESLPKWQNNTCKINQLTLNFSQEKERTKRNGYFAAYGFSTVEALSLYAVSAAKTTPFFEFIQCTDLSIIDVQTKSLSNRQSPDVTITSCNKSFIGRSKFITALTDASTSQPVMVSEGRQISFTMSNCISDGRGLLKIANLSATRIMIESCVTRNHAKPFFAMATSVDTFSFNKADIDNID